MTIENNSYIFFKKNSKINNLFFVKQKKIYTR